MKEALYTPQVFAQQNYENHNFVKNVPNYTHFASPMVHPTTGETISGYKWLMHDPAMAEVWQMVFGKDFGGMAQGDDKTGQKGTNSIFVVTHTKIKQAYVDKVTFTYAQIVVDFRPQKEDPYRIRITAGEISWHIKGTFLPEQRTYQHQNYCGTASSALTAPNTCIST